MRNFFTAPALVDIALTNRCNLKCNYCSASSGESTLNNNELDNILKSIGDIIVY